MRTDFSYYLTNFLTQYLPGEIGVSHNTVSSYRDAFILFLIFCRDRKNIPAENLSLPMITRKVVLDFLEWIETERKCSTATRNVRLAAIHSFFRYLQYENPDHLLEWQKILSIPVKKTKKKTLNYMSTEGIKLLLGMPDQSTQKGKRDLALLSLMYDSCARVQEIIDLTPSAIRFDKPYTVKLIGKGNKARIVPVMEPMVLLLKQYMEIHELMEPYANKYPLFQNKKKEKLTRAGVGYILNKYIEMARKANKTIIPDRFSCHCLRHSKAIHMLQAGVNLVYIRDILGHCSVQTTEIYARTDSKHKRDAIEKAYTEMVPPELPVWKVDKNLLEWLKNYNK
jgi:site-specific recombinase XerD